MSPLVSFVLGLALGAFFAGVLFKRRLRKIRQAIEPLPDRLAEELPSEVRFELEERQRTAASPTGFTTRRI